MPDDSEPKATLLGKLVILIILAACGYLSWRYFLAGMVLPAVGGGAPATVSGGATPTPVPEGKGIKITVGYGTEKERWLVWAVEEFAKVEPTVQITLVPKGSLEGGQALMAGEKLHIWAPAASLTTEGFAAEWQLKNGKAPFLRTENLALTPMVFVFWNERFAALKTPPASFKDIAVLVAEPTGWAGLAGKPDWGFFKFGHTHPNQSNSGLMALVLMACDWHNSRELTMAQVLDPGFQAWLTKFEKGVAGMSRSTGSQMKDMVLKGPSAYDALCVYENVAIDYLKNAQGRWGDLRVTYPAVNAWNDNPAYLMDAPWSSAAERAAASRFLDFLMTEPVQRRALDHGFRPGNPAVPIRFEASPFVLYQPQGLRIDLPAVIQTPKAEVVNNLLAGWQRSVGR